MKFREIIFFLTNISKLSNNLLKSSFINQTHFIKRYIEYEWRRDRRKIKEFRFFSTTEK